MKLDFEKQVVDNQTIYTLPAIYKEAIETLLTDLTNFFYRDDANNYIIKYYASNPLIEPKLVKNVSVNLTNDLGSNYFNVNDNKIVLSDALMASLLEQDVPAFCVFYHELGHYLFSRPICKFEVELEQYLNAQAAMNNNNIVTVKTPNKYRPYKSYHNLINWIEDFYIESKLKSTYTYLNDIVNTLYKMDLQGVDLLDIKNAFRYFYKYKKPTPTLSQQDQITFTRYINRLLSLRNDPKFSHDSFTLLTLTFNPTIEYSKILFDFYEWCVNKNIFDADEYDPPLPNPILQVAGKSSSHGTNTTIGIADSKTNKVFVMPKISNSAIFKTALKNEMKQINNAIIRTLDKRNERNLSKSLATLFTATKYLTPIQQATVAIRNFFNPNRLADRMLFLQTHPLFSNVSIYRDVSGSTHGSPFKLFNDVCLYLQKNLPIDFDFYLYSDGDYPLVKTSFVSWEDSDDDTMPAEYSSNDMITSFDGGTNPAAIADIISQQYNSHWLNIIITDGDLNTLYSRSNISALLKNVFIIFIGAGKYNIDQAIELGLNNSNYIEVNDITDINKISTSIVKCYGE